MKAWLRLLVLFAAVVVSALLLKVLPALVVLALFIGGVAYANYLLTIKPKRETTRTTGEMLGLRPSTEGRTSVLSLPFALVARGSGGSVHDLLTGPWRGLDVKLFGFTYAPAAPPGAPASERAFSCVVAPIQAPTPHVIVEPRSFLTAEGDRPEMPAVELGEASFDAAFEIRSADPAAARAVLGERMRGWLLDEQERWGFEVGDRLVLLYGRPARQADMDTVLEAMDGLLGRLPERLRPAPATAATLPERPDAADVGDDAQGNASV